MVRLKDLHYVAYYIPYQIFQFHMVRLKDGLLIAGRHLADIFQFHMVRLKVMTPEERKRAEENFNSIWCD